MSDDGVGFVGLGIMGQGMASRLLSEGIAGSLERPLVVWNRTPSKCDDLKAAFPDKVVEVKGTAREVVESCGVTYCMLSTPEASRSIFEAEDGILAGVAAGKCIVDCATIRVEDMVRMHDAVAKKGGRFLEAPVSGSKVPAEKGQLVFLCAGSKELFDEVEPTALGAMGKASHFFGEVGFGTKAKLVVNSLMGTMMAAYSEGLSLSQDVGLDPTKMIEVISQSAIASPVYALKGPKMIKGDHAPNFPLKHAHKDMKLASDLAREIGAEYSVMNAAEKIFRNSMEDEVLNVADKDFSAIFEGVKKESPKK